MDGLLLLNKPKGISSHDVIIRAQRVIGIQKIGHAGTLDPIADGLIVLLLGKATKLSPYLTAYDKRYTATMLLGFSTDTLDLSGRLCHRKPLPDSAAIEPAVHQVIGKQLQQPPMFSAIKKEGTPLYKLARDGITVPRNPKPIHIYHIAVESIALPFVEISVHCSKGTYIRVLLHDIAKSLGTCGVMTALTRTAVGPFSIDQAISITEMTQRAKSHSEALPLIPMADALAGFEPITISSSTDRRQIQNGRIPANISTRDRTGTKRFKMVAPSGDLLAVVSQQGNQMKLERVFN